MKNSIEALWKSFGVVNEWIRFSDTKAGAILATNGVIAGLTLSNLLGFKNFSHQTPLFWIPLIIGGATILFSTYFALKCLIPSLKVGKPTSLIYFGHIAQKYPTPSEYEKAAREVFSDEEQIVSQISQQIWANSQIAWKKFKAVTLATYFLGGTIMIVILGAIFTLF